MLHHVLVKPGELRLLSLAFWVQLWKWCFMDMLHEHTSDLTVERCQQRSQQDQSISTHLPKQSLRETQRHNHSWKVSSWRLSREPNRHVTQFTVGCEYTSGSFPRDMRHIADVLGDSSHQKQDDRDVTRARERYTSTIRHSIASSRLCCEIVPR